MKSNSVITEEDGYDVCPNCFRPVMPGDKNCPFCKTHMGMMINEHLLDQTVAEVMDANDYFEYMIEEDFKSNHPICAQCGSILFPGEEKICSNCQEENLIWNYDLSYDYYSMEDMI